MDVENPLLLSVTTKFSSPYHSSDWFWVTSNSYLCCPEFQIFDPTVCVSGARFFGSPRPHPRPSATEPGNELAEPDRSSQLGVSIQRAPLLAQLPLVQKECVYVPEQRVSSRGAVSRSLIPIIVKFHPRDVIVRIYPIL